MLPRLDRPLILRAAALVLGGGAAGLGANALRPGGVAILSFEPPTTCTAEAGSQGGGRPRSPGREPAIAEIAPREASFLCGRAGVVFADTRPASTYEEGHVADAIHLPCDATELGAQAAITHLSHAQTVIVYGDSSDDGRAVAETLRRRGLPGDLRVLRGGFAAWEREGLACASGPCKDCPLAGSTDKTP
jgi:rhodanese-related sulfurtransferase